MLITFLVNYYKKIMNILLILLVIACPIVGGVMGKQLGVLLGLAVALIFAFSTAPFFVLFEINEKLFEINEKLGGKSPKKEKEISITEAERIAEAKYTTEAEHTVETEKREWECPYCGARNAANATMCIACFKLK